MTDQYLEEVEKILESFDYPELVQEFAVEDVARSMAGATRKMFDNGVSSRMCAIIIWSMTMNYQVIPQAKASVKH